MGYCWDHRKIPWAIIPNTPWYTISRPWYFIRRYIKSPWGFNWDPSKRWPCHTTQRVKTNFANASVRVKYVPKRMTPLLQPADVSWMRPLKVAYFKKWNHWLVHAPKSYTAAGNVKSPGYATVITWISGIWLSIYIFTYLFP